MKIIRNKLNKVILMDNTPENNIKQPENWIFINQWFGNEDDNELLTLLPILK